MSDYVVNVFIPKTLDGSAVAIQAHLYAKDHAGSVVVHRSTRESIDTDINFLMHKMTVADCSGFTNLPKHHEVWIVGFDNILPMVNDELRSFRQKDPQNRNYIIEKDAMSFCWNQVSLDEYSVFRLPSVLYFISDVAWEGDDYGGDISLLYSMLIPEDFEALITQILLDRSDAHFIPDEDSIIGIFTRHERMKSLLKAANSQKKP